MSAYQDAKSRRDTRGQHAAYIAARRAIHIQLAADVYGRVKARRVRKMMEGR